MCAHTLLSSFSDVHMYVCLGLTLWDWITPQNHVWRRLILRLPTVTHYLYLHLQVDLGESSPSLHSWGGKVNWLTTLEKRLAHLNPSTPLPSEPTKVCTPQEPGRSCKKKAYTQDHQGPVDTPNADTPHYW